MRFYELNAKYPVIAGSDKNELIRITRSDTATSVEIYERDANGDPGNQKFRRTFLNNETKEIQIHSFGGDDYVIFKGDTKKGIRMIMNAGSGQNQVLNNAVKTDKNTIYNPYSPIEIKLPKSKLYKLYLKRKL
jgi:hypothetical protein